MVDKKGNITGWQRTKEVEADLIVVDEASMVNQRLWLDLLGTGRPVIAIGDHGQLPPIEGSFNLMEKPDHDARARASTSGGQSDHPAGA
jgi:ATP-dependent exoDNAse (exonuclease V) alpha subunit